MISRWTGGWLAAATMLAIAVGGALPPAAAQTAEVAALHAKTSELYRAGKFSEALPLAQRILEIREKALGPDHLDVAESLNGLAGIYSNLSLYAEAEPLYRRALAIREKARGADHPEVAHALNNLGVLYKNQGRYAEAEPLYRRSLAIREKGLEPTHPDVAASLGNLAILYMAQSRYRDAEPLYKRSLAILEKARGADHPDVAHTLNNLAVLYLKQGRYTEAEPLYRRSLAIRQKALGPEHPDVAASLGNLANLYEALDRHGDAEQFHKRSLAIREKVLGADHLDVAQTLNNVAGLYTKQGRYAEAGPLFQRSLSIIEKRLGPHHPTVALVLNSIGNLHRDQGRFTEAEAICKRALSIREKSLGVDHLDVAESLQNLALVYSDQGRNADAEPLNKRALEIYEKALGPDHPNVAKSLNNLGIIYGALGRRADAEPLYRRSLAIREKLLGPDSTEVVATLMNLAGIYVSQNRYDDAELLVKRSMAIVEKAFGPEHPNLGKALGNLAGIYKEQRRYADAEPLFRRSLAIREKALGFDHPEVVPTVNNLIALYRSQRRTADALALSQRVIANGQARPSYVLPVLLDARREKLISDQKALDDGLDVVSRDSQTSAAAAVGKLAVRLAAGNDRLAQLVRKDQDLAGEAELLDKSIFAAVAKEPSKRDVAAEQRGKERLAANSQERAALQKIFAAEFPEYAALSKPLPMTSEEIRALLSPDEAVVLFSTGPTETYVFALTRERFDWKTIPLGADALTQKVAAFRRGLDVDRIAAASEASGNAGLFDLDVAYQFYVTLFRPVDALVQDKKQLIVVPSGALTALPFHLLVTWKPAAAIPAKFEGYRDASWLIKHQAVSVMPSVASLKTLRAFARKAQSGKPMIGFGDPIFDFNKTVPGDKRAAATKSQARALATGSYTDFWQGAGIDRSRLAQSLPQLPDTADELNAVALKLGAPATDIHLGRDASETRVKRAPLADYSVVYFATHGLVAGDVKGLAEPSLVLSIPRQPSELDDGLLTASEVAQLKLNAEWVVLSACNTIAGGKPGAEALSGLARSFFYAGARALLVSHWAVDSEAATRLTTSTFDRLKSDPKIGRAEALRQAMLGYLNDASSPRNAYPGFWGPFALIGEGATR